MRGPDLPLRLARLHQDTPVGARVEVRVPRGVDTGHLLTGAGFRVESQSQSKSVTTVNATRLRTLPDIVGPGMAVLVCGLNPSLYSADAGVNFARPGNRFWPAALASGLVTRDRDPWHALDQQGVGWTDLVKRATVGAAELTKAEYADGVVRLRWLVDFLRPTLVCFVGLAGWRAAVDRHAVGGRQRDGFAGAIAYVMPNTSGLNARYPPAELAADLRAAKRLAEKSRAQR